MQGVMQGVIAGTIPELGRYAGTVLGAYGVTLALLGGLVVASFWRAARVRRTLGDIEAQLGRSSDGTR